MVLAHIVAVPNENENERRTRVRRFRLTFVPFLSETVFAHVFPVSKENENERRTLVPGTREMEAESGVLARI